MKKKLHTLFIIFCAFAAFWVNVPEVGSQEKTIIKKGDLFPEILLDAPAKSEHQSYLGIKKGERLERTAWLTDLVPTICYLMNWPVPEKAEGAVIYQAFEEPDFRFKEEEGKDSTNP